MNQNQDNNQVSLVVSQKELEVIKAIREINFGSIVAVIHDGEIVQVEVTNKRRF